jgi:hypothetical protein
MSGTSPSFVSLEAFVDAMVIVEGLKAAGKDLTREKFISGIESIHKRHEVTKQYAFCGRR